jgi:transcriptional regulator with XRE-family HTH domain
LNLNQHAANADRETLLRFPGQLVQLRQSRQISQKRLALTLLMDPSQLSGLERGSRPPPGQGTLVSIANALSLESDERELLEWSARHDRCIRSVLEAASADEAKLVSCVLSTAVLMTTQQREGLSDYLRGLRSAALQINLLTSMKTAPQPFSKGNTT